VPVVWIHDYHLMLAATTIRQVAEEQDLTCKIGFFLHIPFPPWDIIKIFPWHDLILQVRRGVFYQTHPLHACATTRPLYGGTHGQTHRRTES
jgi:hypothetical protein